MGSYLLIITLNVNGLNASTKRQRLAEWIQKQDPSICCLQETHLKTGDTYRLKVKGWKKIFHANGDQKKAGVAVLSSVQFSRSVVSNSLRHHESQHARPPCPLPSPRVHSNSCPSSRPPASGARNNRSEVTYRAPGVTAFSLPQGKLPPMLHPKLVPWELSD